MKPIAAILLLAAALSPLRLEAQVSPAASDPNSSANLIVPELKPEMLDLIPTFSVADMRKAIDFYYNKLGFSIVLQSGAAYTAMGRDQVQIGLALDKGAAKVRKGSCYIQMTEVDRFYRDVVGRGVKPTSALKTQPSKMREFSVTDPDGDVLIFGEYVGPK